MSLATLQAATGGLWPYLVMIVVGFLPTEFWRTLAVIVSRNLREDSEILAWVRMLASALLAGVVAKLLFFPSGVLGSIPLWGRCGAIASGLIAMMLFRRSVLVAVVVGETFLIAAGFFG